MSEKTVLNNPYTNREDYRCFACDPSHKDGLHMVFHLEGDEVVSEWTADPRFEGWTGVLHGGIQATLLDEAAAWAVMALTGTAGVTTGIDLKYLKACPSEGTVLRIRARVAERSRREAVLAVSLETGDGTIVTEGTVTYALFPERLARDRFGFPGSEALTSPPTS